MFTGGPGADVLGATGGRADGVKFASAVNADGSSTFSYGIDLSRGGGRESVTFTDVTAADRVGNGLTPPTAAEIAADGLRKTALSLNVPDEQLAILGHLPGVVNGTTKARGEIIADPIAPTPGPEENYLLDSVPSGVPPSLGLARLFEFDDGTSLLDMIAAGKITSIDDLFTALQRLAGDANVQKNSDPNQPEIHLHLTKTLAGTGDVSLAFSALGGTVQLSGEIDVSVDVTLDITFGVTVGADNVPAFYLRTDGAAPELVLDNVEVEGSFEGSGRAASYRSTSTARPSAPRTSSSRSTSTCSASHTLPLDEIDAADLLALGTPTLSGGPLVLDGDVGVSAVFLGDEEPFLLGALDKTVVSTMS